MQESRAARADEDTTAVKWTEKVAVSLIKRIHVGRVQVQRLQPQNSTPRLRNTNWRLILIVCVEVEADIWPLYMSVCHWWWYVKERVCVCVGGGAADSSVLTLMWMFLGADRLVLFCGPAVSRSGHNCCPQFSSEMSLRWLEWFRYRRLCWFSGSFILWMYIDRVFIVSLWIFFNVDHH